MTNQIELRIAERIGFADDTRFGDAGGYERIAGRAHFAVDPRAAVQRDVVDLDKAPVDAGGLFPLQNRRHCSAASKRLLEDHPSAKHVAKRIWDLRKADGHLHRVSGR